MTLQSSFLLRYYLSGAPGQPQIRACQITHVQSGAEFKAADPLSATEWINVRNYEYFLTKNNQPAEPEDSKEEE